MQPPDWSLPFELMYDASDYVVSAVLGQRKEATSSRQLKNICVLSGFRYGKYKEFVQVAIDLGRAIAERKLHLVYGGGDRGLSNLVSEAAFVRGTQVLGIIPKALKPLGCLPDPPTGEELVVSGMQERISET
ncbi:probable cytokinin riboside 5'-monophosphate phosphoribohydrolase LOGL8 [Citrus clementina]|uniref:probable cytokinin riboside 5'-monophosphate phosphoribohydrolase LOGL8 n=1 Tax=Citrus clementina TaxID=85681 RepID=UPI000CED0460|nr:probable cytokinin riboside 5'-monophosphate phosphoribohydrolase LOGL8 [Citrus x clementina]